MSGGNKSQAGFPWREWLALAAILLAGLALRAAWLTEYSQSPDFSHPMYDPEYNAYWAKGLASGDWTVPEGVNDPEIRTTPYGRPPGYPFFLAGVYALFGVSDWPPRIAQAGLGMAAVVLMWLLARALFGRGTAVAAALGMALYWAFPYYESQLTYPSVVIVLLLGLMHLVRLWAVRPRVWHALGMGVLMGLFGLFRPNGLAFLPVLALWMAWTAARSGLLRRWLPSMALLGMGLLAVLFPVFARNYLVSKDFVFISAYGGLNFYAGNNPEAPLVEPRVPGLKKLTGMENWSCFDYPAIVRGLARELGREDLSYSKANRWFYAQAVHFILENPGRFLGNTLRKTLLFWGPREITNDTVAELDKARSPVLGPMPGFPLVLALFSLGAAVFARRFTASAAPPPQWRAALAVLLFIPVYFLSVVPYFIAGRYRLPVLPFMLLFGGYGVASLCVWMRRRAWRKSAAALLCLGAALAAASANITGYEASAATWQLRRAMAWTACGNDVKALEAYEAALVAGANPALVHGNMGRILARAGDGAGAVGHYDQALAADPGNAVVLVNLGVEHERNGNRRQALECYKRAAKSAPALPLPRFNLALLLLEDGDARGAAEELRETLALQPANAEAAYQLGRALTELADIPGAARAYVRALEINPAFAEAHNNLGWLLEKAGRLPEAEDSYRRACAAKPGFALAWNNLGNILLLQGRTADARTAYERARTLQPDDPATLHNLGRLLEAEGKSGEAENTYRNLLEAHPGYAPSLNNLGLLLSARGELQEAEALFRRAIAAQPELHQAVVNLVRLLCSLGRTVEAQDAYTTAIKGLTMENHVQKALGDALAGCAPSPPAS